MHRMRTPAKNREPLPGGWKFQPASRHNEDWKARWKELFKGEAGPRGRQALTRE